MTIWAIFVCMQVVGRPRGTGMCNAVSHATYFEGIYEPAMAYRSLAQCQNAMVIEYAQGIPAATAIDSSGRMVVAPGEWFACLRMRVPTWSHN